MPARHPLQDINDFPSLVEYLRDELDWPIESESFDDLTFDFAPEELGLKPDEAAKVRDIKQLRPLATNQPWGIFFVDFEPKRLPVVALRKILGNLVVKKRTSANKAERASWKLNDLLFISAFGEGKDRQITLAHFSEGAGGQDIPTLKVLGWDELDTNLNLQHVDRQLHERLRWPATPTDLDAWREQWSAAFTLRHRHAITTAQELAVRLAVLAQSIRQKVKQVLDIETAAGPLRKLYAAFREALIHDLSEDGFADMYAQTITYGLFSAAVSRTTPDAGTVVVPENLAEMVPITNPFLREMLSTFLTVGGRKGKLDFDELGIQEVVEVLNSPETNLTAVVRNFGDQRQGEDPVIHFYEDFLRQYDKKRKVERGVFYTPQPVVSYIVRSVHELLRTEFGLEDGLASTVTWSEMVKRHKGLVIPKGAKAEDPFVVILDPATGTATFLVEVIDVIYRTMTEKWKRERLSASQQRDEWNKYVPAHLLPRLYGYELMMAPYAIAHMKIGLKLGETGYRFQSEERARIYLTNALEPASDLAASKAASLFEALGHEAQAVNVVKREQRFSVVIGNPPYSNFGQLNKNAFILGLLDDYKRNLNERKINLDDDFIKFIRFAQYTIDKCGAGVLGFITNNVYIDGITHRQMRQSLIDSFHLSFFCDLHGNISAKECSPDGSDDDNVFDIKQGVAIAVMAHKCASPDESHVFQRDVWGSRSAKYLSLSAGSVKADQFSRVLLRRPELRFNNTASAGIDEYNSWPMISDNARVVAYGIQTKQDALFVAFTKDELREKLSSVLADLREHGPDFTAQKHGLGSSSGWSIAKLDKVVFDESKIRRVYYRPFDVRYIYYDAKALGRARFETMQHMLRNNVGLIVMRQVFQDVDEYSHFGVTRDLIDERTFYSNRGGTYLVPVYFKLAGRSLLLGDASHPYESNLSPEFLGSLAAGGPATQDESVACAYAVLHSPNFRRRYLSSLKAAFPRIPLPRTAQLACELASCGAELISLHLLESPKLAKSPAALIGRSLEVQKVGWTEDGGGTVWIDAGGSKNATRPGTSGFVGVSAEVWNFEVGGYRVCEKWLKDRKGRTLSKDDVAHYKKIVASLSETILLMGNIDEVIERHGGWPGAFSAEQSPKANTGVSGQTPFV